MDKVRVRSCRFAAAVVAWLAGMGGALAMPYADPRIEQRESQEPNP